MNQTQKIIKYCAIAFAFLLIASILSGIVAIISGVFGFFDFSGEPTAKLEKIELTNNIKNLDLELNTTDLVIKSGKKFAIETNNRHINIEENNDKLIVKEEKKHFTYNKNNDFILYVPTNFVFGEVRIKAGAGNLNVRTLSAEDLYLNIGAGNVSIYEAYVDNKTNIEGGVGKLEIKNGVLNDLDLDIGIGETVINSILNGDSSISAGVGAVKLTLIGTKFDYEVRTKKGIGTITIDGKNVNNETTLGNGNSKVKIDGGVGSIDVKFKEEKATL